MGKHDLALQHAMKALILIQDEIINRMGSDGDQTPAERLVVLSIAYHNIGVEYEFLKKYQQALNAYKKSVLNAETHLTSSNLMTANLKNVYDKAINKIADVIIKSIKRKGTKQVNNLNLIINCYFKLNYFYCLRLYLALIESDDIQ